LCLFVLCFSASAQESGNLTIYATGKWSKKARTKAMMPGLFKGDAPSIATLFDGNEKFAYIFPGQFISIEIPRGKHVLSASREFGRPDGKAPVELTIEPGGHYFYRMRVTGSDEFWFRSTGHLDLVSCKEAQDEAAAYKPISLKNVEKDRRSAVMNLDTFPKCK
jgi:hypothetical protein